MIVINIVQIVFAFLVFALSHYYLDSNKLKQLLSKRAGADLAFFRLFYTIASLIALLLSIELLPDFSLVIYDLVYPYDFLTLFFQIIFLLSFFFSIRKEDILAYIGIRQIIKSGGSIEESSSDMKFIPEKQCKICRHPSYLFLILFIVARPVMDLNLLVYSVLLIIYIIVFLQREEKENLIKFGDEFRHYCSRVPMLIPYKLRG